MEAKGLRGSGKNALVALERYCRANIENAILDLVLLQSLGIQMQFCELLGSSGVKSPGDFSKSLEDTVKKVVENLYITESPRFKKSDINLLEYPYLTYISLTCVEIVTVQDFTSVRTMLDDFGDNQLVNLYQELVLHLSQST